LANGNLPELEKLTREFPYFQTAHLLYAISSKKNDASAFQRSIKKTAIVAVSRNHLYELLYNAREEKPVEVVEEVKPVKVESDVVILELPDDKKVAEVKIDTSTGSVNEKQVELPVINEKVEQKKTDINEQVEREIQKDVVEAFVEKEVLHTNTAHKKDIPLPVDANFTQWLKFIRQKNEGDVEEFKKEEVSTGTNVEKKVDEAVLKKKERQKSIIDKIIDSDPKSIKLNKESKFFAADQKAKESLLENEELVTETLAKIYALQGNINKAIRAYQILSLKYPNKSAYFASLIEDLRKKDK
jgi:hypothetical protein